MGKGFPEIIKAMQDAKKERKKMEKIKGFISDTNKILTAANHVFRGNKVESPGAILKLGYEGIERVAAGCPLVSQYLKYHKKHIDALAGVLKARKMGELVERLYLAGNPMSVGLEGSAREISNKHNFVSLMVDGNNKIDLNRLPIQFKDYYNYTDLNEYWRKEDLDSLAVRRERLGLFILKRSNEMAKTYYYFRIDYKKLFKAYQKADEYLRKLLKSERNADFSIGKGVEDSLQKLWVMNGVYEKNKSEDLKLFLDGKWWKCSPMVRGHKAMTKIKILSEKWQQWARLVKSDMHLEMY